MNETLEYESLRKTVRKKVFRFPLFTDNVVTEEICMSRQRSWLSKGQNIFIDSFEMSPNEPKILPKANFRDKISILPTPHGYLKSKQFCPFYETFLRKKKERKRVSYLEHHKKGKIS
ncbi:CLUMA_CG004834, isoform A [Clunio marinus]|uniref:CLUMA_CG004834, isoform A n=1 Tax=Clunio marinus TaxID=568069 RepID=A0A1J1HUV6_9DIPT|nr:CLUMA_CG004834, isoform A [Clunio marinus]